MEVKTQIFDVPTSSGDVSWTIGGWSSTPVAAKFVMVATDGTDSYDDNSVISIGFTDGTNEYSVIATSTDGGGTSAGYRENSTSDLFLFNYIDATAAFSQWESGGVEVTFGGTQISSTTHKVIVTFFAGADVDAAVIQASAGDHVTSLSFSSKLIFSACHGDTINTNSSVHILSQGVCTNGTNGLEQNFISNFWNPGQGTSTGSSFLETAHVAGQAAPDIDWESAINTIDSSGFNLDSSNADDIIFLCLNFDEDVDSGYASIPTSGSINNTTPGFEPQFVGVLLCNNTSVDTKQNSGDLAMGIGEYDGTRENSVTIVGEDGATTMNHTSVHSSEIMHLEDADQSDIYDSSSITLDSSGFDVAFTTHPSSATYYIWWAVEEEAGNDPISGSITTSSTVTGDGTARGQISGGAGLGADLKDAELINDDANWTAYGTTTIAQNGSYVNFIGGNDSRGGYIDLDATVLTSAPTDGVQYSIRGVVWSESGAINVSLHGSVSGELDSAAIADGAIVRFGLIGIEETGGANNIEFSGVAASEEFNIYVYSVRPVQGSSVSGDLKGSSELSGTVNTSSTITGDVQGRSELSSTVSTSSTVSGDLINVGASYISGTITTSSTVTGDILGNTELSGTINGSSSVSGNLTFTASISGSISTLSAVTGDIIGTTVLSGTVNTSSTVSGDVDYQDFISQNGAWVNIIAGSKSTHAKMILDTIVLTSDLTDDVKYQVRGILWSESGAVTVALYNEDGLEDSEGIVDGGIERFELTGWKTSSGDLYVTFTDFAEGEELNIFIYVVAKVDGSTVVGDLTSGTPPHDYITGTITTSSTVSGAILGNTELTVTVATSSTVSANLTAVVPITGSISTASTVTGDIVGTTELSGTISTSSTVTGDIVGTTELSGSISTASTVIGDIVGRFELSGTVNTSSTVTADLTSRTSIEGTINTFSTVSGYVITPTSEIAGTISTSSTVTGDIAGTTELSGSISTSSTVTGDIVGTTELSGTISTSSTVTGDLVIGAQKKFITGSISTFSTVTADLIIGAQKGWMTASVPTSSTVQADLSRRYITLSGSILTSSTVGGSLITHTSIEGTIVTFSTVTGKIISEGSLSGSVNTSSQVSGLIKAYNRRTVSITTSSTVNGDLIIGAQKKFITGSVSTNSTVSGDLIIGAQKGWMTATVSTSSTVQADLSRRYITLNGSITTGSTVSGDITFEQNLYGTILTGSTVSGGVKTPSISGTISTYSTVSGKIRDIASFGGVIQTYSTVSGFVKAYLRATGSISTSSTVSGDLVIGAQKKWISGSISTGSTVSADLTVGAQRRWITGSIVTSSTVSGDLIIAGIKGWITGTISTGTTVSAGINYKVQVSGSVSTFSAVSGSLKGVGSITSNIVTASSVAGVVIGRGYRAGAVTTSTTLTAKLTGRAQASGSVSTESIVDGHLAGRHGISGSFLTYSQITGDVKGIGILGGISPGLSLVLGEIREKGVPRDWWDIVVPSDLLDGLVVAESVFDAKMTEEVHKLITADPEEGLWVYENNFGIPVVEDQFTGMPEEIDELLIVED
jgi:hypothetical protein